MSKKTVKNVKKKYRWVLDRWAETNWVSRSPSKLARRKAHLVEMGTKKMSCSTISVGRTTSKIQGYLRCKKCLSFAEKMMGKIEIVEK